MFQSQRPQPRPAALRWHYHRIAPGQSLRGWVAGVLVGVYVHWSDGSKPCRKKMTSGMLECPMCVAGVKLRWIGYLPLWDMRGRQVVAAVSETLGELCTNLAVGTAVELYRSNGARDPLRVKVMYGPEVGKLPDGFQRAGPQDIRPWLLHLWQDRDLASKLQQEQGDTNAHSPPYPTPPAPPAVPPPPPPPRPSDAPAQNGQQSTPSLKPGGLAAEARRREQLEAERNGTAGGGGKQQPAEQPASKPGKAKRRRKGQ